MSTDATLIAGRYRLESVLGRGGMGQVWRAHDVTLDRAVAVKEIRFPAGVADEERDDLRARMMREARLTARLSHPGIATTYDVVLHDDRPFIVMELVDAVSLSEEIKRLGPLPTHQAADIGLHLLDALDAAHREGIVHRDVKPSNVLLSRDGRVILTDFGIATSDTDPSLTATGLLVGSPTYMSPERLRGEPTGPPADIWSLGATLYSAVEGRPPFSADTTMGTITSVLTDEAPVPSVPGPLRDVLLGMLHKDPAARLTSGQVRSGLDRTVRSGVSASEEETRRMMEVPPALLPPPEISAPGERTTVTHPQPVPGPAPNENVASFADQGLPPQSSPRRPGGRTLRVGLGLVVLVAAAVICVIWLYDSGDDSGPGGRSAAAGNGHGTSSASTPSDSTGTSTSTTSTPQTPSAPTVPAGYRLHNDPLGFRVAVPHGWERRLDAATRVDFVSPDGTEFLRVDQQAQAGPDAAQAWRDIEPSVAASLDGYHRIRIEPVDYRDWKAADWEFTWKGSGGTIHVIDRGIVTDTKGWALYVSAPDATWTTQGLPLFQTASRTFQPTS
jgi:serine/threonine protein kinase